MNIQTGDEEVSRTPDTNFTVVRVKRDILRRSTVGAMFTNRSVSTVAAGIEPGLRRGRGVRLLSEHQHRRATGPQDADRGARRRRRQLSGEVRLPADRYGARAEYLKVGDNFNPEVGFLRRDDFKRSFAQLRFSPRPQNMPLRAQVHL